MNMNLEELKCFLETPKKLLSMDKEKLTLLFDSDFAMMKGYSQDNPHHCYDLLEHTVHTLDVINCDGLSEDDTLELKIAALYHDVGKPKVAFEKNGKTVFYNHATESRRIAAKELRKFDLDNDVLDRILFYVEYHDAFISFKLPSEIRDKRNSFINPIEKETVNSKINSIQKKCVAKKIYVPMHKDFILLLRLCLADVEAQSSEVFQNGVLIDSKKMKVKRLKTIRDLIEFN